MASLHDEVGTTADLAGDRKQLPELCVLSGPLLPEDHCYSRSSKDHDYIRRTKNSCCDLKIQPDMVHWTPRAKFLDNTRNKCELIHLLTSTFRKYHITVEQCDNDADTSIVRQALAAASDCYVEVTNILCLYFPTTRLVVVGAGVVSKEEFSQLIFNPYLEWFIMLCIVLFSGAGR